MSFKALRVWQALQAMPGLRVCELARATGMDASALSDALRRLRLAGCAKSVGHRHDNPEWYGTKKQPFDGRGGHRRSKEALAINLLPWPEALKIANRARIKRKVIPPKKAPAFSTELEKCWPRPRVLSQTGQDE